MLRGRPQSASNSTGGRTLSHLAVTSPHRAPPKQQIRLSRAPTRQTWRHSDGPHDGWQERRCARKAAQLAAASDDAAGNDIAA
jgi:hypothetical protein